MPLPQVGISLRPDETKGNTTGHIPTGAADPEGRFELATVGERGAPPGWYKVVVIPYSPGPVDVPPPPYNVKYVDVNTTDLSIEVKKDAPPGAYDLKLSR